MRILKFGGKSLSNVERFDFIAKKLSKEDLKKVIIVVSAMGNTTSELFKMTQALGSKNSKREQDMLLTSGERISAALMSMALQKYGIKAQSFTGSQAGILTSGPHTDANIKEVKPIRVKDCLEKGIVPVIAGFQGVDPDLKDITTLGRGGSDLTAVALASYFKGSVEFYKSIGGVFTSDPILCSNAKPIKTLSHSFLKNISSWGAKVIHEKAASLALENNIPIHFLNDTSFEVITKTTDSKNDSDEIFSINCIDSILTLAVENKEIPEALTYLNSNLRDETKNNTEFKIIASAHDSKNSRFLIKTDENEEESLIDKVKKTSSISILETNLVGVSCIFSKEPDQTKKEDIFNCIKGISIKRLLETNNRLTFFIKEDLKLELINRIHNLLTV